MTTLGADVSSLQRALDLGARFYSEDGTRGDPLQILKEHGVNSIRLRVWVDPANGCHNKARTLDFAKRIKTLGFGLLIDFHYSDTWADPEHQFKPAAWEAHSIEGLQTDVRDFTRDVCEGLIAEGATPDMVQIGNEINSGMLWPEGRLTGGDFTDLSLLLKAGCRAVKDCSESIQIMVHIANAGDQAYAQAFFAAIREKGVQWDLTGLSYYSYWHGSLAAMAGTVGRMRSLFDKPVVIAETAYPFTLKDADHEKNSVHSRSQLSTGYPATPAGQRKNLRAVLDTAEAAGAIGAFYWEPTWIATPGNGWNPADGSSGDQWENQALFDFDGKALPALGEFKR